MGGLSKKIVGAQHHGSVGLGLSRVEAAFYIGISPSKFDEMVRDGRMCSPKRIDARVVWDIRQLDAAFEKLPSDEAHDDDVNSWDEP
jgi:hypothetical protein